MKNNFVKTFIAVASICIVGCKGASVAVVSQKQAPVVTVTEIDPAGNRVSLGIDHKIVDPNSDLQIDINENTLFEELSDAEQNEGLTDRLELMQQMLQGEVEAIKELGEAIKKYDTRGDWKTSMASLRPMVNLILTDEQGIAIYEAMAPKNDIIAQYADLFLAGRELADQLEEAIREEARKNGIYVQFGAWIESKEGSRPVHIPGFDDLSEDQFRVDQFQIVLTEEQRKEVQEFAALAQTANQEGLLAALDTKKAIETMIGEFLKSKVGDQVMALQTSIQSYLDDANLQLGNTRQELSDARDKLQEYRSLILSLVGKYKQQGTTDASDLLLQFDRDMAIVVERTKTLTIDITAAATAIQNNLAGLQATTVAILQKTATDLNNIGNAAEVELTKFTGDVRTSIQMILAGERFSNSGYEFAREVRRVSFDELQRQTVLRLETTGKRDIGDLLTLKLVASRADGRTKELANFRYYLHFCTPYVRTAVNFLFTDPTPLFEGAKDKSLFHYAPSYSILLKGFWKNEINSRKKLPYHNLYSPGIGINIATLDFNSDGAPEVGISGVFSIFQDFIQVGYGFNTFDGKGYSFFGLKIPVGAFSLR